MEKTITVTSDKNKTKNTPMVVNDANVRLVSLLEHPRNKSIYFDPFRRSFIYNVSKKKKLALKGLNPALKSVFWPDYEYTPSAYRSGGTGVKNSWDGLARGKYVHSQIEDYINLPIKDFMKKHETLHNYTKKAIIAMRQWKLLPCRAEFKIYDLESFVATKLDALLLDEKGEFCLFDWKCGLDDYILKGVGMMRGPMSKYSDCPLHQAYLQILFEMVWLKKHYNFVIPNLYVVQIIQDGIIAHPLPSSLVENSEEIYQFFNSELKRLKDNKAKSSKIKNVIKKRVIEKKKKSQK